jgi:hypothetical protein
MLALTILVLVLALVVGLALWYGQVQTFIQPPVPMISIPVAPASGPVLTDITKCSWENEPPCRLP